METDTNQFVLPKISSYDIEQLKHIHPRLCTLYKWSHYNGYGIHLTCNEDWRGLHIDDVEPNSPGESAGLLHGDIVFAVNGYSIENEDFSVIISFIQHELKQDQIRFLVLDPHSAALVQRNQININEDNENCIRKETQKFMKDSNQIIMHNLSNEILNDINKISNEDEDTFQSEPRICSVNLHSGVGPIGISLQSDTDFSHIITHVKPNSPAARAGIEQNDCILSINNTSLLHVPFENVLYFLAKSLKKPKLNFLVAKKSFLLQSSQNQQNSNTNIIERKRSSTLPIIETSEQYDRLSLQMYSHLNVTKHKKRHGTILRFPWNEKTIDYSSIRSDLYDRRIVMNDIKENRSTLKDMFNCLQVGMTNQSPSSIKRLHHSPKLISNLNLTMKRNDSFNTPIPISPILHINEQDNQQFSPTDLHLATMSFSELPDHGYELHNIKLMKSTETILIGFKLTKQMDPLQYIMTSIIEQSQADIADKDIRLIDFDNVSQEIDDLLNTIGFVNILIARKKSSISNENNILLSVGLSNPIEDKIQESLIKQTSDSNLDKIRHITLKETSGLYFNSFISTNNEQIYIHFMINIQPISIVYRSGLRKNDRILTVDNIDVTKIPEEDLRFMLSEKKSIELTVTQDSNYLEAIENFKRNQQKCSETIDYKQSKELNNILFIDEQGPVYIKHCLIEKDSKYDTLGFLLNYEDDIHIIDSVQIDLPGYISGLRDRDIILFINKKSVQQMTHDDLIIYLRSLVISNQIIDLITINQIDVKRYRNYQRKRFIDWYSILFKINDNSTNEEHGYINQQIDTLYDPSSSSLLSTARICILETDPNCSAGFTIENVYPPPYIISKIEKYSLAEKAGLKLNDAILSVNGRSVMESSYEDTIDIIKEALKQKFIQFVVNQKTRKNQYGSSKKGSEVLSLSSGSDNDDRNTNENIFINQTAHNSRTIVQQYQKQRSKELSYAIRLCHLNTTNSDGIPASSFGFEITGNLEYGYPIITRVVPKLPGEQSGLQTDDILLKVNNRKTKGADFEKIKKSIEKAKRDGRLEMLVVDKDTFDYCLKTKKKFKEPYIKVKHIFPPRKSSTNYQSLPLIVAQASSTTPENRERSINEIACCNKQSENEENNLKSIKFEETMNCDLPTSNAYPPIDISKKFIDPARRLSQQMKTAIRNPSISKTTQNETSTDESIIDFVLNAVNNFFQNVGSEKSSINLDYDIPPDRTNNSKTPTPLLSTFRPNENLYKDIPSNRQINATMHSSQSPVSYDYIKDPRQCVLHIDRTKGLGFVLSATGDYDHTITSVDKNSVADMAGLQIDDEVIEINGIDVRNIQYEQVVNMLISAMQTNDTIEISPNLHDPLNHIFDRGLSRSVPVLSTGITASPKDFRSIKPISTSPKNSTTKTFKIFKKDTPIARLCRIRKIPSSPFYGFFLCGDPKKLGRVFISNITKNSSAAICGLRDGDYIIEVNGTNIQTLTYETILNIIKLHMEHENLELLVLDKKSAHWYHRHKYPITTQTLPTIVHIEPIINQKNSIGQL